MEDLFLPVCVLCWIRSSNIDILPEKLVGVSGELLPGGDKMFGVGVSGVSGGRLSDAVPCVGGGLCAVICWEVWLFVGVRLVRILDVGDCVTVLGQSGWRRMALGRDGVTAGGQLTLKSSREAEGGKEVIFSCRRLLSMLVRRFS